MKRTQFYLDEIQDDALGRRARASGTTKSALIRAAVDDFLTRERDPDALATVLRETAGALPGLGRPSRDEWDRGYG
jgi:predicted transcriptional regulator